MKGKINAGDYDCISNQKRERESIDIFNLLFQDLETAEW